MKNRPLKKLLSQDEIEYEGNTNIWGRVLGVIIFLAVVTLTLFALFSGGLNPTRDQEITTDTVALSNDNNNPETLVATATKNPTRTATPIVLVPSKTPYIFPTSSSPADSLAQISCADVKKVNLRKSPGYINKNNKKDVVREVPCGEYVKLLGENQVKDDLNWWRVGWNGNEGWIADHTGSGKVILVFDQSPSFSQSNPEEFIYWYFNALWQERNYELLWRECLTSKFQNHSSPGGINEYSGWWDTVKRSDVHSVEVLKAEGRRTWVKVIVTFYLTDGRVLKDRLYEYDLIYDTENEIWMFDYRN
jgi:hypothetical protein